MNKRITLLYVEDDKQTVEAFLDAFGDVFKNILVAYNAEDGFELFVQEKPDMVLTDLQMPKVSGLEMIAKIREVNNTIPIIVNSAFNNTNFLIESIAMHVNEYTMKPINPYALLAILEDIGKKIILEKEMRKSQEMLQTIINEIPYPILYLNTNREVQLYNIAANKLDISQVINPYTKCHELLFKRHKKCDNKLFNCPIEYVKKTKKPTTLHNIEILFENRPSYFDIHMRPIIEQETQEISGFVEIMHDVTDYVHMHQNLLEQKEQLEHISMHDQLTRLPNRRLLGDRVEQLIKRKLRSGETFGIFFIDLDHFKEVNDSMGHLAGDLLLIEFSKRIRKSIREEDTFARLGGDEFILLLENGPDMTHYEEFAVKIQEILKEPFVIDNKEIYSPCSIGISIFPKDGNTVENLISNADAAMYASKHSGRHTYSFYDTSMRAKSQSYVDIGSQLVHAMKTDAFVLHFQPIYSVKKEKYTKVEVLVRWLHPEEGIIFPDAFLTIAQKAGLMVSLDFWIFENALKQLSQGWVEESDLESISLNVTAETFFSKNFVARFRDLIEKYNFNPSMIVLEIVESELMKDVLLAQKIFKQLNQIGVKIALDDFATGYSSLSYLLEFSINILKIDKSFIQKMKSDSKSIKLVRSIISLAGVLECEVIAEGVELISQKKSLLAEKVDYIQGYYFSKPLDVVALKQLMTTHI